MKEVGLNIGCGGLTRLSDTENLKWVNIDTRDNVGASLVCDCRKLPYKNESVSQITTVHLLEHLPRWEAPKAVKEWYRVLKNGGILDVETPNFDLTVKEYLEGDEKRQETRVENVYGRQFFEGDTHFWGYNLRRITKLLKDAGFRTVVEIKEWSYHQKEEPCLHVIATK